MHLSVGDKLSLRLCGCPLTGIPHVITLIGRPHHGQTFLNLYGCNPVLPTEVLSKHPDRCYIEYDDYRSQLVQNLSAAWSKAK